MKSLSGDVLRRCIVLFLVCLTTGIALLAQREPVLKQIDLPHPYYFREMYLPQLTSGPSSVAWSGSRSATESTS